jgi:putative membrane protein insertion efficiency factor
MTGVTADSGGGSDAMRSILLLPRNAAVATLIAYRTAVSPLYGEVCRYYPSCSAYAMHAIAQHGAVIGSGLALRRIARCHPWAAGGVDDAPPKKNFRYTVTPRGFVVVPASHRKG